MLGWSSLESAASVAPSLGTPSYSLVNERAGTGERRLRFWGSGFRGTKRDSSLRRPTISQERDGKKNVGLLRSE